VENAGDREKIEKNTKFFFQKKKKKKKEDDARQIYIV
jgi:hypothetical protein